LASSRHILSASLAALQETVMDRLTPPPSPIHIIGAGLAGSEAAWTLAEAGQDVVVHEMRPVRATPAHHTGDCAELVCSNSFRSDDWENNAVGLLHAELRALGSLIMRCADRHQVPAGAALAVDRDGFSAAVTQALRSHPRIRFVTEEVSALPPEAWGQSIVATGPLTGAGLSAAIHAETGADALAFFDAIAPIVYLDTVDFSVAWRQSRYDKPGPGGDTAAYINCPMDKDQYGRFLDALLSAPRTAFKDWEKDTPYFEGCLPIEVMAERGRDTLRFGPMKPIGLTDPRTGKGAYAVVQLRQDNALGTLFNLVGFQTKLKHAAQADVFRMIPGLERAVFARLGGIHRNTFIDSPRLLDGTLRLKSKPHVRFAGQITGCEGYVESAAIGRLAALFALGDMRNLEVPPPPATTALGALLAHVTGGHLGGSPGSFQPMNINFGLFPPLDEAPVRDDAGRRLKGPERGRQRKRGLSHRAVEDLKVWVRDLARVGVTP
jgi:methylenetetrahydrofolate--tRNA-(uracil-5-)-methyltransferase